MNDIPEGIECLIISQYKYLIYILYRNRATYKESVTKVNTITAKLEREVRFYAEHILCRIVLYGKYINVKKTPGAACV